MCIVFVVCLPLTHSHSFYNRAVRKVTRLAEAYKKMDEAYTKACSLFCESPKTTEPSEFFAHFRDFVAAFKV